MRRRKYVSWKKMEFRNFIVGLITYYYSKIHFSYRVEPRFDRVFQLKSWADAMIVIYSIRRVFYGTKLRRVLSAVKR